MSQHINLFDPALQRKRDWLALENVVGMACVLLTAVGAAGLTARSELPALMAQSAAGEAQLKTMRDQLTVLGQQVANRKPDPRLEQEIGAAKLLLAARSEVLNVLQQRMGPEAGSYAEYLRGFARQSLPGLWLTGFSLDAGGSMEIHGRTSDPALLPEYIRRLNAERVFQGRAFAALNLAEGKADAVAGAPAPTGAAPAAKKAPFHEFRLVPVKPSGAADGGQAPVLGQLPATGGKG